MAMSAVGPKRYIPICAAMPAFEGKPDMRNVSCPDPAERSGRQTLTLAYGDMRRPMEANTLGVITALGIVAISIGIAWLLFALFKANKTE